MLKTAVLTGCAVVLLLGCAALAVRAAWINDKIGALTAPASTAFASANMKVQVPTKGSKLRVVLIGDSRVARWPMDPMASSYDVINRGIGGETTAQLAERFHADALALAPDVIVVESGINDLVAASFMGAESSAVVERAVEALHLIAGAASKQGIRVFIATIIPPAKPDFLRWPIWNETLRDLVAGANKRLANTEWPEWVSLIDLSAQVSADGRTLAEEFRADTLHLNEAGYRKLTGILAPYLQKSP